MFAFMHSCHSMLTFLFLRVLISLHCHFCFVLLADSIFIILDPIMFAIRLMCDECLNMNKWWAMRVDSSFLVLNMKYLQRLLQSIYGIHGHDRIHGHFWTFSNNWLNHWLSLVHSLHNFRAQYFKNCSFRWWEWLLFLFHILNFPTLHPFSCDFYSPFSQGLIIKSRSGIDSDVKEFAPPVSESSGETTLKEEDRLLNVVSWRLTGELGWFHSMVVSDCHLYF